MQQAKHLHIFVQNKQGAVWIKCITKRRRSLRSWRSFVPGFWQYYSPWYLLVIFDILKWNCDISLFAVSTIGCSTDCHCGWVNKFCSSLHKAILFLHVCLSKLEARLFIAFCNSDIFLKSPWELAKRPSSFHNFICGLKSTTIFGIWRYSVVVQTGVWLVHTPASPGIGSKVTVASNIIDCGSCNPQSRSWPNIILLIGKATPYRGINCIHNLSS